MATQLTNMGTVEMGNGRGRTATPRTPGRLSAVYQNLLGKTSRAAERRPVALRAVPVRLFANEDICFHVKRIDNSRLIRQADPKTGGVCWKLIGSVAAAAVLLIGVLLPSAYGLLAGYQIQALKEEAKHLTNEQASLELEEAQLLSPERMEQLAREQQFVDPEPQKVVYLDSTHGAAVAMNEPARQPKK